MTFGNPQSLADSFSIRRTALMMNLVLTGGLVVLGIFVRVEANTSYPLIRVRIFRERAFAVDNGVLFFSMIAFVPVFFFASVYAQECYRPDARESALGGRRCAP